MRLSRKPSAVRRRRLFFGCLALAAVAGVVLATAHPDTARAFAAQLGFGALGESERVRLQLPADLGQPPYDSYLSASRAAGFDFAKFAGRQVLHVAFCVGRLGGTDQRIYLNIYLSGRRVVGAFLTGAEAGEAATPINAPGLMIEPLSDD